MLHYQVQHDSVGVNKVGEKWAAEGQQSQHAHCETPFGGSHGSAGATAGDSHVIQ